MKEIRVAYPRVSKAGEPLNEAICRCVFGAEGKRAHTRKAFPAALRG